MNPVMLEIYAKENIDGNVIDPGQDVPFAVLWETYGTLHRLVRSNFDSKEDA